MENSMCLSEIALAARWGISPKTLQRWRSKKCGPPYLKLSKRVTYPIQDVIAYELEHRRMPQQQNCAMTVPTEDDRTVITYPIPNQKFTVREALQRLAEHGHL